VHLQHVGGDELAEHVSGSGVSVLVAMLGSSTGGITDRLLHAALGGFAEMRQHISLIAASILEFGENVSLLVIALVLRLPG
jgi:cobalamin biosynthesis protein CbiG